MPSYCFECENCGHKFDLMLPMSQCKSEPECPICKKWAKRDFSSERPGVIDNAEHTIYDAEREVHLRSENKQANRPIISLLNNQMPDVPKIKGQDGRTYAYFTSEKKRKEFMKREKMDE